MKPLPGRLAVAGLSLIAGCAFIGILTLLIGKTQAGVIILDSQTDIFLYPFTVQNFTHLAFFLGMGELFLRWQTARRELSFLGAHYLPEDAETVLQSHDLGAIRRKVAGQHDDENGFVPGLIDLSILQFQANRSVEQTLGVLNSSLELISHRVDLRYQILRYIAWVIPALGFIGTVIGIAWALAEVNPAAPDLKKLTVTLAVAFNTTLVALVLSAILMFFLHIVQGMEEKSVGAAGSYVLRNLINRLYTGGGQ